MPDQALAGALSNAYQLGAGPYLAVAFGIFVLGVLLLQQRRDAARDAGLSEALTAISDKHERVMVQLAELQRVACESYVRKTELLTQSIHGGIGALVTGMTVTNRELLGAINSVHHQHLIERREDQRDMRGSLDESTAVLARVERVLEIRPRLNGAG